MNFVRAKPEFLARMRELCTAHGAVLVFDEVMSGFRVALGGAQALYGIAPDMTVLGKVIGGGLPVAAFGGRRDIMQQLSPLGPVYQAGTLSGNPVTLAAGMATLKLVQAPDFYQRLSTRTKRLADGLIERAAIHHITLSADALGGMFGFYFLDALPLNLAEVNRADVERFKKFFHAMLARGIYLAPSAYEAGFVSSTHHDAVIDATLAAAESAFAEISGG
jgi:glutamate-1-semialdehyde 2,1-aminomutase